jgi:hypothetical protein
VSLLDKSLRGVTSATVGCAQARKARQSGRPAAALRAQHHIESTFEVAASAARCVSMASGGL